jgi:triacylglycerol esterase/lipase EstA (alpha/beta hydrolase family)
MKQTIHQNDTVVLVHGLGGSRIDMWPLGRRLKRLGYAVRNWGYRSIGQRIETHAERLADDLIAIDADMSAGKIHLVTHSMGGIIARTMLANRDIENLGRVVMLAPPHQGSHVARKLVPYIGWLTPSLNQLSDAEESYVNQLPNSLQSNGIEFGIVEATKDRVIAQGGVLLDGYRDYARVEGHHGVLAWYRQAIQLAEDFLVHGRFK